MQFDIQIIRLVSFIALTSVISVHGIPNPIAISNSLSRDPFPLCPGVLPPPPSAPSLLHSDACTQAVEQIKYAVETNLVVMLGLSAAYASLAILDIMVAGQFKPVAAYVPFDLHSLPSNRVKCIYSCCRCLT
jgi:hypothetical protein